MRPLYSIRCLDTTPRGPRKDRRQNHLRRFAQNCLNQAGIILCMVAFVFGAAEAIFLYGTAGR